MTVPGARYGLISAAFVVFTLVITDFGLPKVIGGQYDAGRRHLQAGVIGQQNSKWAPFVSVILLVPAFLAFRRRSHDAAPAGGLAFRARRPLRAEAAARFRCGLFRILLPGRGLRPRDDRHVPGCAIVKFWAIRPQPVAAQLCLRPHGWGRLGCLLQFDPARSHDGCDRLADRVHRRLHGRKDQGLRARPGDLSYARNAPMAVPGMVLGLAYIFFFNRTANPLHGIYGHDGPFWCCARSPIFTPSPI